MGMYLCSERQGIAAHHFSCFEILSENICKVKRESTKLVCPSRSRLEEPLSCITCCSLNRGAHVVWWRGKEGRAWQVKLFFWKPLKYKNPPSLIL